MNKSELLEELERKFEEIKTELGFSSNFEELDKIFFLKDEVLGREFVSEKYSRQLCARIVELFMTWNSYLHGLVMPNPQNFLSLTEAKRIDVELRKEIGDAMKIGMMISSWNNLIGLTKNKSEEAKFIDEAVRAWNDEYNSILIKVLTTISDGWKE